MDSIDSLLRFKVEKWRGRLPRNTEVDVHESSTEEMEGNIFNDLDLG